MKTARFVAIVAVMLCLVLVACAGCGKKEQAEPEKKVMETAVEMVTAPKDIVDVAVANGSFTTLVTAVKAAGLVETLKGEGPFTVFAPTDDAFAKLPPGTIDELLADLPKLKSILLYHVVPGKVTAAEVVTMETATTAAGEPVSIKLEDGKVYINGAKVITPDVEASNGVIHVIDTVILPPVK